MAGGGNSSDHMLDYLEFDIMANHRFFFSYASHNYTNAPFDRREPQKGFNLLERFFEDLRSLVSDLSGDDPEEVAYIVATNFTNY